MNSINLRRLLFLSNLMFWGNSIQPFIITQADITAGLTINESGLWELGESVTFNDQYGIVVNTQDVVIDLKGYTIDGLQQGNVAIQIMSNNCRLLNGTLKNSVGTAIEIINSSGVYINEINIGDCRSGFLVLASDYTTIDSCSIIGAQESNILIEDSPYTSLAQITITNGSNEGIAIIGNSGDSLLNQIKISNCTGQGIRVSSDGVILKAIIIFFIAGDGIIMTGNDLEMSLCSISLNNGNGCRISGLNAMLQQCNFGKNGKDGILLESTTANTEITGGQSSGNSAIGINNLGSTSNKAHYVDARFNKIRDFWRIINTP